MAECKSARVNASVEDLEKEITCSICHENYSEPKVLPCCHYYCKQCIHRLTFRTGGINKPFHCPECRKEITLGGEGGVDSLPTAFFINRMKEIYSKLKRAHGKVDAMCEFCVGDQAEAFCRQCAQFICNKCIESHQRMKKLFPEHKIATLDELRIGGPDEIVIQKSPHRICTVHREPIKVYCFDCSSLICRDCTIKDHLKHDYEFISVAAPSIKKKLIQHLDPIKEAELNLTCALKKIQITKSRIEAEGGSISSRIQSLFKELQMILKMREHELLKEAARIVSEKLEHLRSQEKNLSTACAIKQSVIEYTEQSLEHLSEDEVMCIHDDLKNRIDKEIEEYGKEELNLEPVEEVNIKVMVNCAENLKQLCQTKATVTQHIDPAKCIITGEGIKTAEINQVTKLYLKTKLANGKNTKCLCSVVCHLKSLANGSTIKCNVPYVVGNEYLIQYTPIVRGQHELTVAVNGQEIAGSPFHILVAAPTQRGTFLGRLLVHV